MTVILHVGLQSIIHFFSIKYTYMQYTVCCIYIYIYIYIYSIQYIIIYTIQYIIICRYTVYNYIQYTVYNYIHYTVYNYMRYTVQTCMYCRTECVRGREIFVVHVRPRNYVFFLEIIRNCERSEATVAGEFNGISMAYVSYIHS